MCDYYLGATEIESLDAPISRRLFGYASQRPLGNRNPGKLLVMGIAEVSQFTC